MSRIRILALCDYYRPDAIGGAERVARELYARLADDGTCSVSVVGAVPSSPVGQRHAASDDHLIATTVIGRDLSRFLGAQMTLSASLRRAAFSEAHRFDPMVVHINGLHFQSSQVGVSLAHRLGVPVVTTAHLGEVTTMPGRLGRAANVFDRLAGGRVVRASDRIIAVSGAVAEHVRALGAPPERVRVAWNGVDRDRFNPKGRTPRVGSLRVGLVGRLIANKGYPLAFDAVAEARQMGHDITLQVIGDGPLADEATARAHQLGLDQVITFTGQLDDVAAQLRSIDVLIRPSYTEGLPLAVLEALACGVPCVVSDVPGNAEAVRDGIDGIVVRRGDSAGFRDGLATLATDRNLLEKMSHAAVQGAPRFDWDESARIHLEAFTDVTHSPTTTAAYQPLGPQDPKVPS